MLLMVQMGSCAHVLLRAVLNAVRIDEEEFGGHQALGGEGLAPSLAVFVVRLARPPA